MTNPFPPDLLGYTHGSDYYNMQRTKTRSYAPGNINCDVFHMLLLEHDY